MCHTLYQLTRALHQPAPEISAGFLRETPSVSCEARVSAPVDAYIERPNAAPVFASERRGHGRALAMARNATMQAVSRANAVGVRQPPYRRAETRRRRSTPCAGAMIPGSNRPARGDPAPA